MAEQTGYTRLQIRLHWTIAGLVLFNYIFAGTMERAYDALRDGQLPEGAGHYLHVLVGAVVLVLTLVRLGARVLSGAPAHGTTRGDRAALAIQGLLYALTLVVPVLGMMTWGGGLGWAAAPHVIGANAIMLLAGLHAASALIHQYVLKDRLLLRMMRAR